jgi:hypothetical protein
MDREQDTVSMRGRVNDLNRQRVLREIWANRGVSRTQLARTLKLNKSTISDITSALVQQGLVTEIAVGDSTPLGGRRPRQLSVNRAYGAVAGLDLRADENVAVVMDLDGQVVFSVREERTISGSTATATFLERLASVEAEVARRGRQLLGVGVGVSALVDSPGGIILRSGDLGIENPIAFVEAVRARAGLPVFLEKNSNCCSWERLVFHRDASCGSFLSLLVRFKDQATIERTRGSATAVGMGIVVDGEVFYGADRTAGEFRSVLMPLRPGSQVSFDDETLLRIGDDRGLLARFVEELAGNVAFLVHSMNFKCVFVGGDLEKHADLVRPIFERALDATWNHSLPHNCRVEFFAFDRETVAHGAAAMVLHKLFAVDRDLIGDGTRRGESGLWSGARRKSGAHRARTQRRA